MKEIVLTEKEKTLRQILLDVAEYIGTQNGCKSPVLRITGGWVRDKLLGVTSHDIDIGIDNMTGFEFGTKLKQYLDDNERRNKYGEDVVGTLAKIAANPEKSKHLETAPIKILGLEIDLVNLRKEEYADDSRNPTMEFGSPEEDALRRDSTVNALFYNMNTCQLEDFTRKGLEDMKLGIIRTPMRPYTTFKDDPLRVLRCIRFASRLGYTIDPEAEEAMMDIKITEALHAKISRERIGIEIEKMLKGPRPHYALSLIDRLRLYNDIFTPNPTCKFNINGDTNNWNVVYMQLAQIMGLESEGSDSSQFNAAQYENLRFLLIPNPDDPRERYLAWLLCTLTPWSRKENPNKGKANAKRSPPMASLVAREGLKVDNKGIEVITAAATYFGEVTASKNAFLEDMELSSTGKRKQPALSRESLGMAIRRWGPHWRSVTLYALLVEFMDLQKSDDCPVAVTQWLHWLNNIRKLDLLDVCSVKHIVDGKRLMQAFDKPAGKWVSPALDMVMEWQLRYPENDSPEEVISYVQERRKELGME